jgi:similar to stage IV sporulation protein
MILLMLPIAVALMAFAASLVFSVQVTSPYPLAGEDARRVEQLAEQAGLRPGVSRWRIDLEQAEQAILAGFPEIYYAEVFEHGVHMEISVVKRVDVPEEEKILPPGAVLATADGVIVDILVRRGTAMVESGDTVKKGDVLIHGRVGDNLLAADGIVTASVYGEGYGEWALEQTALRPTGVSSDSLNMVLPGGKQLHLLGAAESPYDLFELHRDSQPLQLWRIIPLPVEILYDEYCQLEQYSLSFGSEEAAQLARTVAAVNAEAAAAVAVGEENIRELHTTVVDIDLDDGLKRARAVSVAVAEIGAYQAYEEGISANDLPLPPVTEDP